MRLVNRMSYGCANHFMKVLEEDHKKRAIYYFAFQVIIGALVKGIVLVSLGLLLDMLLPLSLLVLVFCSLRLLAGGYHMDTYGKCLLVSMALFVSGGAIAKYTYTYWSGQALLLLFSLTSVYALYCIIKYAPKDTPNKPITDPVEIKKFKSLSLIYISAWAVVISLLIYFDKTLFALSIDFGVLLEVFTLTPIGHKFFDKIKGTLTKNKRRSCNSCC